MKDFYISDFKFSTRYADFDFRDELKISAFLNFMQEAAGLNANKLGCGSEYLWPRGLGFIVANNYLEVYRSVKTSETLTVRTWALPPKRIVFERNYEIYGEDGGKIAVATSRWCLLDIKNKKMLPASTLETQNYEKYCQTKTIDFNAWKIQPFDVTEKEPDFSMTVRSSEYDHYCHVNNVRYADFCMNCFSVQELSEKRVTSFLISYEDQCLEGDELCFYRLSLSESEFVIVGKKLNGKEFMRAKLTLADKIKK